MEILVVRGLLRFKSWSSTSICDLSQVFLLQSIKKNIEQAFQNPVVVRMTIAQFLVVHIYFLVVIDSGHHFPSLNMKEPMSRV